MLRLDRRLEDAETGFSGGLAGPAGVSELDIVAGALPFLRRDAVDATGGGAGAGGGCGGACTTLCLLDRRLRFPESVTPAAGLVSEAFLRFLLLGAGAGVWTAGGGGGRREGVVLAAGETTAPAPAAAVAAAELAEAAAWLAA